MEPEVQQTDMRVHVEVTLPTIVNSCRNVERTGKFCAGGEVDACQVGLSISPAICISILLLYAKWLFVKVAFYRLYIYIHIYSYIIYVNPPIPIFIYLYIFTGGQWGAADVRVRRHLSDRRHCQQRQRVIIQNITSDILMITELIMIFIITITLF